jgi:hypothetical protein
MNLISLQQVTKKQLAIIITTLILLASLLIGSFFIVQNQNNNTKNTLTSGDNNNKTLPKKQPLINYIEKGGNIIMSKLDSREQYFYNCRTANLSKSVIPPIQELKLLESNLSTQGIGQNEKQQVIGNFNNDDQLDTIWRNNETGQNLIRYMNGKDIKSTEFITTTADIEWKIQGAGDLNGDRIDEIILRNSITGDNAIWTKKGNQWEKYFTTKVEDKSWNIIGVINCGKNNNSNSIIWYKKDSDPDKSYLTLWNVDKDNFTVTSSFILTNLYDLNKDYGFTSYELSPDRGYNVDIDYRI